MIDLIRKPDVENIFSEDDMTTNILAFHLDMNVGEYSKEKLEKAYKWINENILDKKI